MRFSFALLLVCLFLLACEEEDQAEEEPPVRRLKTHLVSTSEQSTIRRFPSVLEPTSLNTLSFEIGGRLTDLALQVGQRVSAGEVLATLDDEALELLIAGAEAGLRSAEAAHGNALQTLRRQEELFERGTTTRVAVEDAQADVRTREAQLVQAQASLFSAVEDLDKAVLEAPFDAIVNSVEVQSFATVSAGAPIVSLYSPETLEVSITANFGTFSQLVVGTSATVRPADRPDLALSAVVSELGARAEAVSSFPVVLTLAESAPILRAGMAVEVAIELPLPAAEGYSIPLTAIIKEGTIDWRGRRGAAQVFVYDEETATVQRRDIRIAGVRENSLLVIEGLSPGDRVASAGVSFLRDGQEVKLLDDGK